MTIEKDDLKEGAPERSGLRSVSRALRALMLFREEPELGVREIARQLDLNPAVAYRLVTTLTLYGFLEQLPVQQTYTLGHSVGELAEVFHRSRGFSQKALTLMGRLHNSTRETIGLHMLHEGLRLCVLTLESPQPLRMVLPLGSFMSVTNGATDLVLYSFGTEEQRARVHHRLTEPQWRADTEVARSDGEPPTDAEAQLVVRRGWAASYGARTLGSAAIAAPVRLSHGLYALSLLGPAERVRAMGERAIVDQVLEVAAAMETELEGLRPTIVPDNTVF
ncbi:IclR family transcriptional regulator [Pseudonocardia xishanensis]